MADEKTRPEGPSAVMHILRLNRQDRRALARNADVTPAEFMDGLAELVNRGLLKVHPNPARRPMRVWVTEAGDDERD